MAGALLPGKWKAPQSVCFAGLINPGSYLLSRDLSSDYHRRADVSLPGSEWDRVGPSGYDHQVSGSGVFCFLPIWLSSALAGCCLSAGRQADIRVALGFAFPLSCTHSRLHLIQAEIACHRGDCIRSIGC